MLADPRTTPSALDDELWTLTNAGQALPGMQVGMNRFFNMTNPLVGQSQITPNQQTYLGIMGFPPEEPDWATSGMTQSGPTPYPGMAGRLPVQQADYLGGAFANMRAGQELQPPKLENENPTQHMLGKALLGALIARLFGDKKGRAAQGILGGMQAGRSADVQTRNKQAMMDYEREKGIFDNEARILGMQHQEQARKENAYRTAMEKQSGLDEKAHARLRLQAEGLSKQYGGSKKAGDIRRLGKALQAFADANPDYAAYAPTDEQIESDIATLTEANQMKASEQWTKALEKVAKTYGYIGEDDAAKLSITRKAIADKYEIDEDELMPILTAKSEGLKKLEETVRANKAREGETHRHNMKLEGAAEKRIGIMAGNLQVARGRLAVAQQNANTYRATSEGKGALQTAQSVWNDAEKRLRELRPLIARYGGMKERNQQQQSLYEGYLAEEEYLRGLKEQATMTADEARAVNGVIQGFNQSFGGNMPQVTIPGPSTPGWIPPNTNTAIGGGGKAAAPKNTPPANTSIWTRRKNK